jgi:hypothetical protein
VGGGDGATISAKNRTTWAFRLLNATYDKEKDTVESLNTEKIPASEDEQAKEKIRNIASYLNSKSNTLIKQ